MKKFLLKVSVFVVYILLWHIVFPFLVDPFNVFHVDNIRDNGVQPNQNYIKMKYILDNPSIYNGFLFGSSRVGALHTDKIPREKVYNMAYPDGLPSEHFLSISTLLKNNIRPSIVYIGIDSISYTHEIEEHIDDHLRCPYEILKEDKIHFCSLYLNPHVTLKSLLFIRNSFFVALEGFYNYGWTIRYGNSPFDWEHSNISPVIGKKFDDTALMNSLNDISKIVDLCRKQEIKLVMFTNPMYYVTYLDSIGKRYFDFLEGVANITDFYNFSSLNDITINKEYYREPSHYKAEVGDIIIDIMCNGKTYPELQAQGFGVKINRDNVKEFINMLKRQAEDFTHNNSPAK